MKTSNRSKTVLAAVAVAGVGLVAFTVVTGAQRSLLEPVGILAVMLVVAVVLERRMDIPDGDVDQFWGDLRDELERSRRRHHRLALVRIPVVGRTVNPTAVRSLIRGMDRMVYRDGALLLMLPESDREAAENLVERLRAAPVGLTDASARMAVFPDDGVTERILIRGLMGQSIFREPLGRAGIVGEQAQTMTLIKGSSDDFTMPGSGAAS